MTTTTTDRAEINRRNAQKSTGPMTPEGKSRSRFNAVKHGMAAKTLVLPGEDPEVLRERIEAWTADLQPENDLEQYLVDRAAAVSWQLDRADRADTARLAGIIRTAPAEEAHRQEGEAALLGRRLFLDSHAALRDVILEGRELPLPHSGGPDTPDHPAAIVHQLEATADGCRWLLDRWTELGATLEAHRDWPLHDRLKAFRLLGKPSLDAPGDADVAAVMSLAAQRQALAEHLDVMDSPEVDLSDADLQELAREGIELTDEEIPIPTPQADAVVRDQLRAIVGRSMARLEALAASHGERAEADAAEQAARLSFDGSVEAERLRRYQFGCNRALFRTLDTLLKLRRAASSGNGMRDGRSGPDRSSPAEPETVAKTFARILSAEDNEPMPTTSSEALLGGQPQETEIGIRSFNAEAAEDEFERIEEKTGESELTDEIREETAGNDRETEPTVADGDHPNLQNEPMTPANVDQSPRNEPITPASDHRNPQNEPILDGSFRAGGTPDLQARPAAVQLQEVMNE